MSYPPVFEPSELKPFLAAGHGIDPDDLYSVFPRGTGHYRKRRITTTAPRRVSIQRVMTPSEMAAYDDWFETNIVVGETHFTALIANNQGAGQLWFDACWIAPYQSEPIATPKGIFWRLTGNLLLSGPGTAVRPDDGTLAVEYVAHLRGSAAVVGTHLLAVEYSAHLSPTMLLAVEYAADFTSTVTVFIPAPTGPITITGLAPSIIRSSAFLPGRGTITISGLAPSIAQAALAAPGAGSITLSGLIPTVTVAAPPVDFPFSPGAGAITVSGVAPSISQDPYGANVVLRIDGEGGVIQDTSPLLQTITNIGSTTSTTTTPVAGSYSPSLNGSSQGLIAGSVTEWGIGGAAELSSNFTIEIKFRTGSDISTLQDLFSTRSVSGSDQHGIEINLGTVSTVPGCLIVAAYYGTASVDFTIASGVLAANTAYDLAFMEGPLANTYCVYLNGTQIATFSKTGGGAPYSGAGIGLAQLGGNNRWFGGELEIRVTNGVARYTGTYTPPATWPL